MYDIFRQAGHPNNNTNIHSRPKSNFEQSNHGQTTLFHFYIALNIWSSLTNSLKATKDINIYKCKVKTHFLDRKK